MNENIHRMQVPPDGAVIRMYNVGLGDCFLIGFPGLDGGTCFVMIDCGSLKGTKGVSARMRAVMSSIGQATAGQGIEILVATHKHWDHLSGFKQAEKEFAKLQVRNVWLGWTENPADVDAARLNAEERLHFDALRGLAESAHQFGYREEALSMMNLLKFEHGPDDLQFLGVTSTRDLLEIVRSKVDEPEYLAPSLKRRPLPGASDVNVFVLGPPKDLTLMRKSAPSKGKHSEVYLADIPKSEVVALYTATRLFAKKYEELTPEEIRLREQTFPFDSQRGLWIGPLLTGDPPYARFFRDNYGFRPDDLGPDWRRIDLDWLAYGTDLALKLDRHRNNTSVVLAFELGKGGPVLLFPGDAQVGSWLSWDRLEGSPTAEDLLRRTALYKVGHHGSHNATLKAKGLNRMTSRDFVAMLPVDEELARKPKGRNERGWNMPYPNLLDALTIQTHGRVLRSDEGFYDFGGEAAADTEIWQSFLRATKVVNYRRSNTPLFVQYSFERNLR